MRINCEWIVGKYELIPLLFNDSFLSNNSQEFWFYVWRLQHSGMDEMIRNSTLHNDYLSSRVLQFNDASPGVKVTFAVYFQLNSSATNEDALRRTIFNYLSRSEREIGESKMYVSNSLLNKVVVEDLDECGRSPSDNNLSPLHDCDPNSVCNNVVGYYECVCSFDYKDESAEVNFKGRNCSAFDRKKDDLEREKALSMAGCTDGVCETPWNLVVIVTSVTFSLLFLLLVIEVVCRTKQMRKQVDEKRRRKSCRRMTLIQESLLNGSTSIIT